MNAYIKSISYYLPENILTNEELVKEFPEWSVDKIADKVGVTKRHISAEKETAVDMAVSVGNKLFDEHNINPTDIDFILLCTQSPDYKLPTSACIVQHRLGIPTSAGALDFNLGCSGYIYGLSLAKGLIMGGISKNILLITSETYTKYIHIKDKGNRTIFGDAASATLISISGDYLIENFSLGTDGSGADNLMIKSGGQRYPICSDEIIFDENGNPKSPDHLYMNGAEIFSFTQRAVPDLIVKTLEKNNLSLNDISMVIFHQASKFMLDFLRKKIKINENKFFIHMNDIGNTVSSTIPIALYEAQKKELIKGNILLAGFGVGYSYGATILKYIKNK